MLNPYIKLLNQQPVQGDSMTITEYTGSRANTVFQELTIEFNKQANR